MSKNKKVGVYIATSILLIIFFVFITRDKTVTRESWDELELLSTQTQVEKQIGKPENIYEERVDMLNIIDKEYAETVDFYNQMTIMSNGDFEEGLSLMEKELDVLSSIHDAVNNDKNIKIYEYLVKTDDKPNSKFTYFYGGELFHYTGAKIK